MENNFNSSIESTSCLTNTTELIANCSSAAAAQANRDSFRILSFQNKVKNTLYYKVAEKLELVSRFIIFPSGIITNTVSLFVMSMKHNRKMTTCLYLSITAVTDNLMLIRLILTDLFVKFSPYPFDNYACKVYVYFMFTVSGFSAYTIVLMTFDRFCAVVYPHKSGIQCTRKRVVKLTCFNFIFTTVFYLPLIFITERLESTSDSFCIKHSYKNWYIQVHLVLQIIFFPVVPIVALFNMNISIIVALKRSDLNVTSTLSEAARRLQQRQVTMMLLLVSFTFMILLLPQEIRNLVLLWHQPKGGVMETARSMLVFRVTFEMMMFNHVINFYLYLISGSKFRNDLKALFHYKKVKQSSHRAQDKAEVATQNTSVQSSPEKNEDTNWWFGHRHKSAEEGAPCLCFKTPTMQCTRIPVLKPLRHCLCPWKPRAGLTSFFPIVCVLCLNSPWNPADSFKNHTDGNCTWMETTGATWSRSLWGDTRHTVLFTVRKTNLRWNIVSSFTTNVPEKIELSLVIFQASSRIDRAVSMEKTFPWREHTRDAVHFSWGSLISTAIELSESWKLSWCTAEWLSVCIPDVSLNRIVKKLFLFEWHQRNVDFATRITDSDTHSSSHSKREKYFIDQCVKIVRWCKRRAQICLSRDVSPCKNITGCVGWQEKIFCSFCLIMFLCSLLSGQVLQGHVYSHLRHLHMKAPVFTAWFLRDTPGVTRIVRWSWQSLNFTSCNAGTFFTFVSTGQFKAQLNFEAFCCIFPLFLDNFNHDLHGQKGDRTLQWNITEPLEDIEAR